MKLSQIRHDLARYIEDAIHQNIFHGTFRNIEFSQRQLAIHIALLAEINGLIREKQATDDAIRTAIKEAFKQSCALFIGKESTQKMDQAYLTSLFHHNSGKGMQTSAAGVKFHGGSINFNNFNSAQDAVHKGIGTKGHAMLFTFKNLKSIELDCSKKPNQAEVEVKAQTSALSLSTMIAEMKRYIAASKTSNSRFLTSWFRDTGFSAKQIQIQEELVKALETMATKLGAQNKKNLQHALNTAYKKSCDLLIGNDDNSLFKRHGQTSVKTSMRVGLIGTPKTKEDIIEGGIGTRGHNLLFNFKNLIATMTEADLDFATVATNNNSAPTLRQ